MAVTYSELGEEACCVERLPAPARQKPDHQAPPSPTSLMNHSLHLKFGPLRFTFHFIWQSLG